MAVTGGTQTLTGANTYSGGTTIGSNGGAVSSTLQLGGASSAGTGAITFGSMSGTATARLGLNVAAQPTNGGTFANTISNFGSGNEIALAGLTNSSVSYNSANSSITITGTRSGGGQVSENFVLSAPRTTNFTVVSDGQGGTIVRAATATNPTNPTNPAAPSQPANPAPCYVTGTRIRVLRDRVISDVPVEHLEVGDLAITAGGKPRPIRWIGSRSYPGFTAPRRDCPVRITAGALADNVPARDLLLSPDHALWLDGLFVAAGHLVNGTSITRGEAVQDLTYWHVELDSHDLLMAENTPAESFLSAPGVRAGFDGVQALDAGTAPMAYAPRSELSPELAALRGRLALRAISSNEAGGLGSVRAWLDLCAVRADGALHVAGWAQDVGQPNVPVCLDVIVDGAVAAFAVADEFRADLAAAAVGSGRCGFDLGLADVQLSPGMPHVVEVRRSADGLLVCAKHIDAAGAWTALLAA
uniref:Hint domain-containing protein n=1 Tax=Methylobacterium sp. B34 TaxID=95563 RepID=UPI0003485B11|nr:Hint domain-containing protein [Methylobacterium sp. B34]